MKETKLNLKMVLLVKYSLLSGGKKLKHKNLT